MPTHRPRTQVTHTPDIQRALDIAVEYWPGEPPSALLTHLIAEGARAIAQRDEAEKEAHRARVLALAGKYADAYPPGYLEELRSEWPR